VQLLNSEQFPCPLKQLLLTVYPFTLSFKAAIAYWIFLSHLTPLLWSAAIELRTIPLSFKAAIAYWIFLLPYPLKQLLLTGYPFSPYPFVLKCSY